MFYLHGHAAYLHALALREAVRQLTPDHALYYSVLGYIVHALDERFNGLAVADDRDIVRHIRHLIKLMGDDDGREAVFLESYQQIQQRAGIGFVEGGRRLIQNEELCVL